MAFPLNLAKIIFEFNMIDDGAAVEQAEMGIWWDTGAVENQPDDWDDALLGLATIAYTSWADEMPAGFFVDGMTLANVTATHPDGALHLLNEQRYVPGTLWTGESPSNALPFQDTCVMSLYTYTPGTFIPNARRRRGRCYMPPMGSNVISASDPRGVMTQTALDGFIEGFGNMLTAINGYEYNSPETSTFQPGVLSREAQHLYRLTDLRVDNIVDTQRRRTKKLQRAYTSAPFVPA